MTAAVAQDSAQWIAAEAKGQANYVTHYRLRFPLSAPPSTCPVQVTADAVYRLFVNGRPVAAGPTSGDPQHWRVDRIDIAPHLVAGDNVLAASVWYPVKGWSGPMCFMGQAPGFFLHGETMPSLDTDVGAWRGLVDAAYTPQKHDTIRGFFVGDLDQIDGRRYPWGWETPAYDDSAWTKPVSSQASYTLVPRDIPMLEHWPDRLTSVRQCTGATVTDAFLAGKQPVTIPAQTSAIILCDRGVLTNAYPELTLSGGKDARIEMGYAESLYSAKNLKGDRNAVEGKTWIGAMDGLIADGGANRLYRPNWHRTYRYLRLKIETAAEPLTLVDLVGDAVAYPFAERAAFDAGDAELAKIWDVGWRTLRLCAVDNFYDCPYYERLQYAGDSRIEALVSATVSGDDRLMRKAIDQFHDSLGDDGLTSSRYPTRARLVIPPFCNWWIAMIDDYRMLNGDKAFIKNMVPAMESVLKRFERFTGADGLVTFSGKGEWDFIDWGAHLTHGKEKNAGSQAPSGLLSLSHVYALDRAALIMRHLGDDAKAAQYEARSKRIRESVFARCWDAAQGILADDPEKTRFTEHANILGILTDTIPPAEQKAVMQKLLAGTPELAKASIFFRFYSNRALVKAGLADHYLSTLGPWRNQLQANLSTWAEKTEEPSRSDCHAWGSSPNYEFLTTVAGITPAAAGFARVRIAPALGPLDHVVARVPHARGMIEVSFRRNGATGLTGSITLPAGVDGTFEWGGKSQPLTSGTSSIDLR